MSHFHGVRPITQFLFPLSHVNNGHLNARPATRSLAKVRQSLRWWADGKGLAAEAREPHYPPTWLPISTLCVTGSERQDRLCRLEPEVLLPRISVRNFKIRHVCLQNSRGLCRCSLVAHIVKFHHTSFITIRQERYCVIKCKVCKTARVKIYIQY